MQDKKEIETLAAEFESCQKILTALGDEVRQHIIEQMMLHMEDSRGMRVPEITELTHLSRPAVSHHLQILKDAGIVNVNRVGTMNFYHFAPKNSIDKLISVLQHANGMIKSIPDAGDE